MVESVSGGFKGVAWVERDQCMRVLRAADTGIYVLMF